MGIQIAWVLLSQMSAWPLAIHMLRPIVKAGRLRLASVLDDGSGSWRKSVDPMKSTQGFDIFLCLMNHPSAWDALEQSVQTILFLPNACKDRVVSIRRTTRYLAQYSVVFHRFMHPVLLAICDSTTDREVLRAVHPSVFVSIFLHTHVIDLPTSLPPCIPACLPAYLHTYMHT